MSDIHVFGAWVKQHRKARDITQEALAQEVGCTLSMLQKLETGQRRPSHQLADRLARFLNIPDADYSQFMHLLYPAAAPLSPAPSASPPADLRLRPPQALTALFGRETEIADLLAYLRPRQHAAPVRLVTLTGPGGMGKTRLALHLIELLADTFADGVVFVDLSSLRDPQLVIPTLIRTLGMPEPSLDPSAATLIAALQASHMLIVLDNFEQVTPAATSIAQLLAYCPNLRILVTSREPLHVNGEQQYSVPPLALPNLATTREGSAEAPAVALFVARSQALHPAFQLTEDNTAAVVEICRRLDGLPLAIELAATRTRVLGPAALLAQLDHRLDVLKQSTVNMPERHRTLRSTIAWSYELLTAYEQQLFRRLAVFVGSMTVEAAEAVIELGTIEQADPSTTMPGSPAARAARFDVLEGLEALSDKSLLGWALDTTDQPRFRMLETVREYALECLQSSGEYPAVAERHAIHFLELAEIAEPLLKGSEQRTWLIRLEAEHPNLRAALTWTLAMQPVQALRLSGALWRFWYTHGHFREGCQWLQTTLDQGHAASLFQRVQALHGLGALTYAQGEYAQAQRTYEAALAIRRELGDTHGIVSTLNNLGLVARSRGDYAQASSLYEECIPLCQQVGDSWRLAAVLNNLGLLALDQADFARAEYSYQECIVLHRQLGDSMSLCTALTNLGRVAYHCGDYERATEVLSQGLALAQELNDESRQSYNLDTQALVYLVQGQVAAARRVLLASVRIQQRLGAMSDIPRWLELWAALRMAENHAADTACLLGAAAALRETLGAPCAPVDRLLIEATSAQALALLEQQGYAGAWQSGWTMDLHKLLAQLLVEDPGR